MGIKNIYGIMAVIFIAIWLGSCRNEDVDYYPIGKKHLGETYTEYVINNVLPGDTVNRAENGAYPPTLNGLIHPVLPLNWP